MKNSLRLNAKTLRLTRELIREIIVASQQNLAQSPKSKTLRYLENHVPQSLLLETLIQVNSRNQQRSTPLSMNTRQFVRRISNSSTCRAGKGQATLKHPNPQPYNASFVKIHKF